MTGRKGERGRERGRGYGEEGESVALFHRERREKEATREEGGKE